MMKSTYWILVDIVRPYYPVKCHRGDTPLVTVEKAVLMTLCYLGKHVPLSDIGDRFAVAQSTVFKEVKTIIYILCDLRDTFIVWPKESECVVLSRQFEARAGFHGEYFVWLCNFGTFLKKQCSLHRNFVLLSFASF